MWVFLGAYAEARSNHEENRVTGFVPAGVMMINANVGGPFHIFTLAICYVSPCLYTDIRRPGYAVTIASFVVCIIALFCFIITLAMARVGPSSRNFLVQALCLLICTLWLLGSVIAYTVVFATRSADVTASLYGIPIPQSIINQFLQQHGINVQYRHIHYRECFS